MKKIVLFLLLSIQSFAMLTIGDVKAMHDAGVLVSYGNEARGKVVSKNTSPARLIEAKSIDFNGAELYVIPDWLPKMYNLKKLDLNGVQVNIKELQKIKALSRLRILNLNNNSLFEKGGKLMTILSSFKLQQLFLSKTGGDASDYGDLGELSNLYRLDLSQNRLSSLSSLGLENLSSLKFLNLSNNSFSGSFKTNYLPKNSLIELNLSHNNISTFKFNGDFPFLRLLDFSNNRQKLTMDKKYGGLLFLQNITQIAINDDVDLPKGLRKKLGKLIADSPFVLPKMIRIKSRNYEIGKYEVTFAEYDRYCMESGLKKPDDEGWGRGKRPAINVSWHDANAYIKWLNNKTGKNYRLPTEAEWEYVARAGTTTTWSFGDDKSDLKKYAWYDENSYYKGKGHKDYGTHKVGKKRANPWGLYDVHGNVGEWCSDWYSEEEKYRVLRGGSWVSGSNSARSAFRLGNDPSIRSYYMGFRLLRTLP